MISPYPYFPRSQCYHTTSDAYLGVLQELVNRPDFKVSPRGLPCRELMDCKFTVIAPSSNAVTTMSRLRNEAMSRYIIEEFDLYLSGERRAEVWAKRASKFWTKLADKDGLINSNYGYLIFHNHSMPDGGTPWLWAKQCLLADEDTRQAFVRFSLPEHQDHTSKDQVCTMHMYMAIRNRKLHGTAVMRSNDIVRGLAYDMPWFCYLLERMASEIGGIEVGYYTHIAHSLHLYERDLPLAMAMLHGDSDPLTSLQKEEQDA